MLTFHIITLFPDALSSYLGESIIGRAIREKKIRIKFYNPRDLVRGSKSDYRRVDQKPYGGGPGMVLRAEPILKAAAKIKAKNPKIILFSPNGKQFDNKMATHLAKKYRDVILI